MKKAIFILLFTHLFTNEVCGFIDAREDGTLSAGPYNVHRLLVQPDEKRLLPRQSIKVSLNSEGFFVDERGSYLMGYLAIMR